ncbi:MAG TPA: 3-hydroxyacyl-CoA dehydrogenase NAD-binding domain-containing protein [Alphaproteobacteria bacterium]|nr:3-hydroxyacyl-CoA dehydrogenase NAD-binding domain-containing protein [Alphaproteobacteria bacterium]
MSQVHYAREGAVALLTIDNPPVNALNMAIVTGLRDGLRRALEDGAVKAVVVTGAGRAFIAGADISEFGKPRPKDAPQLFEVVEQLEGSPKPVVAAVNGIALGGGLETALGCHYRVAAAGARVGLPEVTLGIIPGACGTQRLPRLVGAKTALDLIVNAKQISAAEAQKLGVVDQVAEGDAVKAAIAFAEARAAEGKPPRRVSRVEDKIKADRGHPEIFADYRKEMGKKFRGFDAPFAAVDAIEAAVNKPFDEGRRYEREIFVRLVNSDQAAAQRHVFFGEREVAKIPDVPKDTPVKKIERAGIIGCGLMGGGIAICFANAGIPVTVVETQQAALDKGLANIRKIFDGNVSGGRMSREAADQRVALIKGTTEYADLKDADLVVEAVFEDMGVKKQVFETLDRVCKPDAILATNTSTLDVDAIASATRRPEKVVGMHFFSPANIMKLLENVRGKATSKETIATVMELSKKLGKTAVLVGVCDGFVGNRMLYAYRRQAEALLEEGALPQQIDKAIFDFGLPMGPFAMQDLAGLDIGLAVRRRLRESLPPTLKLSYIPDRVAEQGRYGQKTGAGWYRYEQGSRTPTPDPAIEMLILDYAKEHGIQRRAIGDQEIVERCMFALVNEGAKILEEGIAARPVDIDIVWIYGYGFPRYRGGPMFWADLVGVKKIYDTVKRLHETHGDWLKPAPLLERLAREGKGFYSR